MDFENCISLRHILGVGVQLIRNGNIADGLEAVEAVIDALNDFIRDVENKELPESYQQQKTVCGGGTAENDGGNEQDAGDNSWIAGLDEDERSFFEAFGDYFVLE